MRYYTYAIADIKNKILYEIAKDYTTQRSDIKLPSEAVFPCPDGYKRFVLDCGGFTDNIVNNVLDGIKYLDFKRNVDYKTDEFISSIMENQDKWTTHAPSDWCSRTEPESYSDPSDAFGEISKQCGTFKRMFKTGDYPIPTQPVLVQIPFTTMSKYMHGLCDTDEKPSTRINYINLESKQQSEPYLGPKLKMSLIGEDNKLEIKYIKQPGADEQDVPILEEGYISAKSFNLYIKYVRTPDWIMYTHTWCQLGDTFDKKIGRDICSKSLEFKRCPIKLAELNGLLDKDGNIHRKNLMLEIFWLGISDRKLYKGKINNWITLKALNTLEQRYEFLLHMKQIPVNWEVNLIDGSPVERFKYRKLVSKTIYKNEVKILLKKYFPQYVDYHQLTKEELDKKNMENQKAYYKLQEELMQLFKQLHLTQYNVLKHPQRS